MRILFISGNHPRHVHYAHAVHEAFPISAAILLDRGSLVPQPPDGLSGIDLANWARHFETRAEKEAEYFGDSPSLPVDSHVYPNMKRMNRCPDLFKMVEEIDPQVVLVFGCGLLKRPLTEFLFRYTPHVINLHLGLSPRYRGAATLFWPFYFLEPSFAGATFHYITPEPDAGDIIHQLVPELNAEDGIHDVACKVVERASSAIVGLLHLFNHAGRWELHRQKSTGKNFLASDFYPQHLRMIYDIYQNDIVKRYLDGELPYREPFLFNQWGA